MTTSIPEKDIKIKTEKTIQQLEAEANEIRTKKTEEFVAKYKKLCEEYKMQMMPKIDLGIQYMK